MENRYYDPNRKNLKKVASGQMRKVYTVAEMSEKHHEIARLLVLGIKNIDIAQQMGVSPEMVSNVKHSPVVREQIAFMSGAKDAATVRVTEQIAEVLPKCVEFLASTIEDEDISTGLRSKNAFGLMAVGGYGASKNINVKGVHAVLTAADIQDIKNEAENIGIQNGLIDISEDSDG